MSWKYGDNVLLISSEQPCRFLSARSIIESKVYFLEMLYSEYNITNYDNFSECFFQILPSVSYEANKNLSKADENTSIEKKLILEKRVENENQQNQQIINQYKGKRIKIGDKVNIKHINSNSYIKYYINFQHLRFSQDKNSNSMQKHFKTKGQQPILSVRLTQRIDSRVIFKIKIDPVLGFKKEGENINIDDSFYFENSKFESSFCFQNMVESNLNYKLDQVSSYDNNIRSPSVMEKSLAFKIFEAVHVSKNQQCSTFKILLNEDLSVDHDEVENNEDQPLCYGDYVRIRHILVDTKQQSFLSCDLNIVGTSPVPIMQIEDMQQEIGTASSIFQIIPKTEKKLKCKIKFQPISPLSKLDPSLRQHTKIVLRHWLTGKYLNIFRDHGVQTHLNDSLDESLIEQEQQKQQFLRGSAKKSNIKPHHIHRQQTIPSPQLDQSGGFFTAQSQIISVSNISVGEKESDSEEYKKKEKAREHWPDGAPPERFNPRLLPKEINSTNSLSIISSQSDEIQITNQSSFYFENSHIDDDTLEHLQVVRGHMPYDQLHAQLKMKNYSGWIEEDTNYEQVYIRNVKAKETVYGLQSNGIDSHDYFFFEQVEPIQISNIQSALSIIYPLIVLSSYPGILQHRHEKLEKDNQVDKSLSTLIKICHWMCDIDDIRKMEQLITMKVNNQKQMIIQEIGLIDMVIKVLYHIWQLNLLEDVKNQNQKIFSLSVVIINFLRLTSKNNLQNSYYIFQWYQMLKNILLLTKILPVEIQIDKLLYELFITTKLNKDYILRDDIQHICQFLLEFEKCNNQALNLLVCFCNFSAENALDKNLQEKIIYEVMAKNKKIIFRDFVYNKNSQKLAIYLNNELLDIDLTLEYENPNLYKYIQSTLQLACDISRGESGLSIEYIKELCPFTTCLKVFDNQNVPQMFRALFKNIFINSFMNYDSRYNKELQLPYQLKLHKNIQLSEGVIFQTNKQRHEFELKYCVKDDTNIFDDENGTNLKKQLLFQLFNLAYIEIFQIQSEDNPRITAMIEIVGVFLRKNFFDNTEIGKLHLLFDELIKNSYTFLIAQRKKQQEEESHKQLKKIDKKDHRFDVEAALQWLKLILECLYFIELYEQDQMYEQFFSLPQACQVFSYSLEDVIEQNKTLKNSDVKNLWKLKQDEKKEIVLNYMTCLEIPDTEVIYYYLKILDFNSRILTQSTISMIYQIFSMRQNILKGFNNLCFIYENNVQFYNLMSEQFYKIQIILVDLKQTNMDPEHDKQYKHFLTQIDESLNSMAINIFNDFLQVKTEDHMIKNDIDECAVAERHNIMQRDKEVRPKFIHQDKYIQQLQIKQQLQEINGSPRKSSHDYNFFKKKKIILKSSKHTSNLVWQILGQYGFDIKTASQKQDMLRHMNFNELITEVIVLIVESNLSHHEQRKLSILETCFMLLIFFCMKNPKNSQDIVDDPNFLVYIRKINLITCKNIQVYNLLFISQLFKDNYNLLIKLEKAQFLLVEELQMNFTKIYYQNINVSEDINLISFDYCIYYIQLLQFFFKLKGADLIQNQVWIFKILKDNKIDIMIKDLLQQCKKYKLALTSQRLYIQIPDKIILLTCFLGTFIKLIKIGKSNTKLIQESKQYISINFISSCLEEFQYWYFLKLELLQFLRVVYIETNTKADETTISDLYTLFDGRIVDDLDRYIQLQAMVGNDQYQFDSEKRNIFNIQNIYSTKDQVIFSKLKDSADQYILFGIIESFLAFCEQYFVGNHSNTKQNLKLINNLQKYFDQIQVLWGKDDVININRKMKPINMRERCFLNSPKVVNNNAIDIKLAKQQAYFQECLQNIKNVLIKIINSDRSITLHRETAVQCDDDQILENAWDCMRHMQTNIIDQKLIDDAHQNEMDILIGMIVKMWVSDTTSFKCVVQNMIELLTDKYASITIQDQIIKIVRHLANFSEHEEISQKIRKDLCSLGYTDFLCKVISRSNISDSSRFEYIIALVDFLDEGQEVQQSLMDYCQTDKENNFLVMIHDYILTNFNEFKEYEKSIAQRAINSSSSNMNDKVFQELYTVIDNKIQCCNQAIQIIQMCCEGHFSQMQNHLREQVNINGKLVENNVNMIQFAIDIFREYIVFSNSRNSIFGQYLLEFLIEIVQGPCFENQEFISKTKILETLEDIMFDLVPSDIEQVNMLKVSDINMASFTKRIYVFVLSLFEGNQDLNLVNTVQSFLNPLVLIKRLIYIYKNIVKEPRQKIIEKLMKRMNGIEEKEKDEDLLQRKNTVNNDKNDKPSDQIPENPQRQTSQVSIPQNNRLDRVLMIEDDKKKEYTISEIEQEFGQKLDELKEEGDLIFILLRLLDFRSPTFQEKLFLAKKEFKAEDKSQELQSIYKNTMRFYKTNTGRIEIINEQNQIQLMFFAKPEISKYLSENTKEKFMENVKRDQPNDKIKGLLEKTNDFIDEMNHFKFIMTNIPVDLDLVFSRTRWIVLFQAFVINFLILFDYQTQNCPQCEGEDPGTNPCICDSNTPTLLGEPLKFFGLVIFALNILNFVLWAILKLKLDLLRAYNSFDNMIKEQKKQDKFKPINAALLLIPQEIIKATEFMKEFMIQNVHKHVYAFQYMCLNSYFLYLSGYAFMTILGIFANRIFFTFLLLDIVERSLMLQNIMKSVTENVDQLIMMGLLGSVIMFIYAMIGFYNQDIHSTMILNLNDQSNIPLCQSPFYCFLNIVDIAMRSGGGVGDFAKQPTPNDGAQFTTRFFYDDSFFIIVNVIWLNVIFGIIIDTFAQLRENKNEQDSERRNNCFICSLEKTIFEKEGIFFEEHTENQHSAWNYFLYIVYIKNKDTIDHSGTESLIYEKFQKDDISWFPIGKALCLESSEDLNDDVKKVQLYMEIDQNIKEILDYTKQQCTNTIKQYTSQYLQL